MECHRNDFLKFFVKICYYFATLYDTITKRLQIKTLKFSSFIFFIVLMFLVLDLVGYRLLTESIQKSHEKDTQILFYKIKNDVDGMLSKLLYDYTKQKDILETKHKKVLNYLATSNQDPLSLNLKPIHDMINQGYKNKPYNIYISNKEYVIKNTTYPKDLNFNLSFAKREFDEHFTNNQIGVSTPIFEKSAKNFFSFSDSYYTKDKAGILQVSYNYPQTKVELESIRKVLDSYQNIVEAKAFIKVNTGFINDLILKDFPSYKPTLEEIQKRIQEGQKVDATLKEKTIYSSEFIKDGVHFHALYFSTKSSIFDDTTIIFSIILDETEYHQDLQNIDYLIGILTIFGLIAIIIISIVRTKEITLSNQDRFIQSAMHELKTPLSIITLNNDLKKAQLGEDEYSNQIDSAVKILHKSYEDMEFMIKKGAEDYVVEILDLEEIVEERIEYFLKIASMNGRKIVSDINSECQVMMSKTELIRLIDNNISNAIKCSVPNSTIEILLRENKLQFKNFGVKIDNTNKIFSKYYRENNVVGGYGLGLNIVKNISQKYNIIFNVVSNSKNNEKNENIFSYLFKCHSDDIS